MPATRTRKSLLLRWWPRRRWLATVEVINPYGLWSAGPYWRRSTAQAMADVLAQGADAVEVEVMRT